MKFCIHLSCCPNGPADRERGAEAVSVSELDYVFSKDNPLYAKLEAKL